jgi:hypothetical protein
MKYVVSKNQSIQIWFSKNYFVSLPNSASDNGDLIADWFIFLSVFQMQ